MIHRGGIVSTGLVVLSVIIFFLAMGVSPAYGATFRVNELSDAADASPGDGVCETSGGVCTLRAAIQEANALAGRDVVKLKGGIYLLTIPGRLEDSGATGDLDITDDLVLKGKGSKKTFINGNRLDRVLHVIGAEVVIKDLTIQNGLAEDGDPGAGEGGGIANSGGAVTIVRCTIANNIAQGPDLGRGGGIANLLDGSLLIREGFVSNNSALSAGNNSSAGGGIFSSPNASLVIRNSTIADNQTMVSGDGHTFGGGLSASNGIEISGSTIAGNVAFSETGTANGGGMNLAGPGSQVSNCRISGNRAVSFALFAHGGGVDSEDTSLTIEDSIISDNSAIGGFYGYGGGMHGSGINAIIVVRRSTSTRNAATTWGGGVYFSSHNESLSIEQGSRIIRNLAGLEGGGVFLSSGTVNVSGDSVIKHNSPDDKNF